MADKIKCTIEVEVGGTLKVTAARTITVEAYSKIEVEVPPETDSSSPVSVNLPQAASDFEFLLITSNHYGSDVTFGAGGTAPIPLDGPLLLFGGGVAGALSSSLSDPLTLANANPDTAAHIQIIIGMDVIFTS